MVTQLADYYLKSFVEIVKPLPNTNQAKKAKACDTNIIQIHLSPRSERAVVLNEIFAKSSYYQDQYQQAGNLLNPYAWHDLHLFCGTTTAPAYHLLSRINKTITVLGEGALASLISAPIANLEQLTKRQRFIRFFCQNDQVYSDLRNELQNYKVSEKAMLSFWTETDSLYAKEYDKYLTKLFYTCSTASNKSASTLQRRKVWLRDIWNIYSNYIWYPLMGLPITGILHHNLKLSRGSTYKVFYPCLLPIYSLIHCRNVGKQFGTSNDGGMLYIPAIMYTIHSFWQYYKGYHNYNKYSGVLKNLALRMADLQTFLTTAKKTNALVQQNLDLEALYGTQLQPIRGLLARLNESSEIGDLLRYLEALPLRSWSYLRIMPVNYWPAINFF